LKIIKDAITTLAGEGRVTLQVPVYEVIMDKGRAMAHTAYDLEEEKIANVPDEWFMSLRNDCPAVGKESGYTFLSRAGWEANKDEIKKAFESSKHPRGTWDDFEKYAERHFAKVKKNADRRIKLLNSKVKQLKEAMKNL